MGESTTSNPYGAAGARFASDGRILPGMVWKAASRPGEIGLDGTGGRMTQMVARSHYIDEHQ